MIGCKMNNCARLWMYYDYDLHGLKRSIVRIEQVQKFAFEIVFFL